jgi:hypothetical protein
MALRRSATGSNGDDVLNLDYVLASAAFVGLLAYLIYALARSERF